MNAAKTRNIVRKFAVFPVLVALWQGAPAEEIDLESTFIGDKEQPSVSYFVPWKPPEGPDRLYRPIHSVAGNVLDPVDRDVHERTMKFYGELSLETSGETPPDDSATE